MARGQHKAKFREEVKDYITLLHRVHGHKEAKNFEPWMCLFIMKMIKRKQIDWATIISDNIDKQVMNVLSTKKFYMTSYLVYMLALQGKYLGLTRVGHISGIKPRVCECFQQL